jgi:CBS domain-containing protein
MAIPILHLIQNQPALITISPNESLQNAVAIMIEYDYSQLPVVENGKPYGNPASLVTSNSIARALRIFGSSLQELCVRDAIVNARTISADEDLFSKMNDLLDAAILILKSDGTIGGIVTNYDTMQYLRHRAEDVLLVEDIETTLKDHIRIAYKGDESNNRGVLQIAINALSNPVDNIRTECQKSFRKFCNQKKINIEESDILEYIDKPFSEIKGDKNFDDLTLNEYIQLARKKEAWAVLEPIFGIADKAFLKMLEGVRKTRNKLMHFRPDIDKVERDQLRFCAEWFKNHPPNITEEIISNSLETPAPINIDVASTVDEINHIEYLEEDALSLSEVVSVDSKYAPLADHLANQPKNQERLVKSFSEIERIIDAPLPAAAREHRAWWANDSQNYAQAWQWLKVNWRVVSINMTNEKVTFARARDREQAYIDFFSTVQNKLREVPPFQLHSANPLGNNWIVLASFNSGQERLILSFAHRQRLRLELYIDTLDKDENKRIFDLLIKQQAPMELAIGQALQWEPLNNRRASRIALYTKGYINDEPEQLEELIKWSVENAIHFNEALKKPLSNLSSESSDEA